jgi:hypothetical protein
MNNPPLKHVADQLSKHGRYGDTMLVHMNPREVEGIASLVPGGKLTINPVTGQPEAFLPFLVPILGSMLGSAAAGAGMLGGLGTLAGSAIGSGLATTLATGDLEQGLISGITGFGLGSALQGLGGAASAAGDIASGTGNAALAAVPDAATAATNAAQNIVGQAAPSAIPGATQAVQGVPMDFSGINSLNAPANVDDLFSNLARGQTANMVNPDLSAIAPNRFADLAGSATAPANTFGNNLMAPIREPGQFIKNLSKPEAFLPMYIGEGTNAGIRAQKAMEESGLNFKREQEKEGSMAREGILRALERVRTDYGMFAGGQVDYAEGGSIESIIKKAASKDVQPDYGAYVNELYGKYGSPSGIQSSLRGTVVNTPPAFDYNALYSGGSGYAPGVSPEFMFFGQAAPSTGGGTGVVTPPISGGGGTSPGVGGGDVISGGGTDFNVADIIGGIDTGPTGGDFVGGNFSAPINVGGYFGTAPSVQPPDGGGGVSGQIRPPYDYINGQPSADTTLGTDIGSVISGGSSFDNPYRPTNPFAQTDIQSFIDSLSPSEDEYWREELAKMPDRQFAEGGMVDSVDPSVEATVNPFQGEYDNLVQSTISAIRGEIENPEPIINQFVQEYGNDAFMQLREQVLQGVQPGAQTQGLVDGPGGGMDDMVQGSISDGRPVAVSPGEYIIPADVVSAAGDGNTGGGAQFFDDLIESIRVSKNGTPEQPKPMKELMG